MRSRDLRLAFLLPAILLAALACESDPQSNAAVEEEEVVVEEDPKLFDVVFGPTYTVSAFDIVPGCDPLEPGDFKSTIGATVNDGSTRRLGQFQLTLASNESIDLPMDKLLRIDEGDELCVFSIETDELNPGDPQHLGEDEWCETLAADTTTLSFPLRMANGCALEVDVEATAIETTEGVVFQPVEAWASSSFNATTQPVNLIDGSELSGTGPLVYQTHTNGGSAEGMWHVASAAGNPPNVDGQWVLFDLGANTDLEGAYVWNHNQAEHTDRGVRFFDILVSSDADPNTAVFTNLGRFELDQACDCATETSQYVDFEAFDVRLVRFVMRAAWSGRMAGGDHREYIGLSEVAFVEAD